MSEVKRSTITMTMRPPVSIVEAEWPLIASAEDKEFDHAFEFRANRTTYWFIGVRRHADGRAIVYATYSHSTAWQNERSRSTKGGVLLLIDCTMDDIIEAIKEVCDDMGLSDCNADDGDRWIPLFDQCVADLPAEVL